MFSIHRREKSWKEKTFSLVVNRSTSFDRGNRCSSKLQLRLHKPTSRNPLRLNQVQSVVKWSAKKRAGIRELMLFCSSFSSDSSVKSFRQRKATNQTINRLSLWLLLSLSRLVLNVFATQRSKHTLHSDFTFVKGNYPSLCSFGLCLSTFVQSFVHRDSKLHSFFFLRLLCCSDLWKSESLFFCLSIAIKLFKKLLCVCLIVSTCFSITFLLLSFSHSLSLGLVLQWK